MNNVQKLTSHSSTMNLNDLTEPKKLKLIISEDAFQDVQELVRNQHKSITELVRLGLGLIKIVLDEIRAGHHLVITDQNGQPLREIVLP